MEKIELPNMEELGELISRIGKTSEIIGLLEIKIKIKESEINQTATTTSKYFQNGKPPSQSYIDNTWKFCGFENELIPLREELVKLSSILEYSKLRYKFLLTMIDIWRTQASNERALGL
jgi:hypothetical protein